LAEKKERIPREDLLDLLFNLFESKAQISFKELVQKTQQPVSWLKEVLADVCDLNRRGPNTGTYQLKVEYRQGTEESGPSNAV
jgi:transcription initiation factor TFIIF subunit beta